MIIPSKTFEKPESGVYHAVLADIVDLGLVTTTFKGVQQTKPMVRFVWILGGPTNPPNLKTSDSEGKPLIASKRYNISSYHENSNLYKDMKQILGVIPDVKADIDGAIGIVRQLVIQRDKSADNTKDFANIMGYFPAQPGVSISVPTGFVKDRNKPVAEQAKFRSKVAAPQQQQPKPQTQAAAPAPQPTSPVPVQGESLEAQIARLTAQLNQTKQGADVSFSAPTANNPF